MWLIVAVFLFLEAPCEASVADRPDPRAAGRFGQAADMESERRSLSIDLGGMPADRPLTFEMWVRLDSLAMHNILLAAAPKSGRHWEAYVRPGNGQLCAYLSKHGDYVSSATLERGRWYFVAFELGERHFALYLDGALALEQRFDVPLQFDDAPLLIGAIEGEVLGIQGLVDDLRISRGARELADFVPHEPLAADHQTIALYGFESVNEGLEHFKNTLADAPPALIRDAYVMPKGNRFLDEVQDEAYAKSPLHGDRLVEHESRMPRARLGAEALRGPVRGEAPARLLLNGAWKMKGAKPSQPPNNAEGRHFATEPEGVAEGWFKPGFDRSGWYSVTVPTSVQSALLELGEIEDPFWDENTYKELMDHGTPADSPAWPFRKARIETQDWWFVREFDVPAGWQGKRTRLYFDGIDYAGSIYLNGHSLGYHEGMFGGPSRDVTELLDFDGPNTLAVRIDHATETWYGHMKGSPGWGWHYGHLISLGIWRDVVLGPVPDVELDAPFARTTSLSADQAELSIEFDLRGHGGAARKVEVLAEIAPRTFEGVPVRFRVEAEAGYGLSKFATSVTLNNPRLWWPNNYGAPDRYGLTLVLRDADTGAVIDVAQTSFGVRTITMEPLRGTVAEEHYRWQFVINGVPMFIKGANWCWTDPMLEVDEAKYEHILELARRGGIQMFRAWGGGIVETDAFYRLCDEKGLLVRQEMPFCWGPPDFHYTKAAMVDQQVTSIVKRLRNHPSLIMWGGGNENVHIHGNDEGLLLVGRRCRQFDPSRPFHRTSPWGGSYHNWGVFHSGLPIDSGFVGNPSVFYGEYGLPTMPSYESVLRFLPEEKLRTWPPSADDGGILMHLNQFSLGDIVKVMRYADYAPIDSWRAYIEQGQMAQADEFSFAANLQRAGSYLNRGGYWFYKMTELFPGQSWGILDFYGNPKIAYYRAKQFGAPRAAFAFARKYEWAPGEAFKAEVHAANDSGVPLEGARAELVVYGSDLQALHTQRWDVPTLGVSQRAPLGDIEVAIPEAQSRPLLVAIRLIGAGGALVNDQWSWYNFHNKTESVEKMEAYPAWGWPGPGNEAAWDEVWNAYAGIPDVGLRALPETSLALTVSGGAAGTLTVTNTGELPAFNVLFDGFPFQYGAFLDENSFFLHPGESRTITYELPAGASLDGLTVRAWNASATPPK